MPPLTRSGKIILVIEGERYDVTNFDHPGEGIKGVYLRDYNGKDVSEEMEYNHGTDHPWYILEEARRLGEYEGVVYLGSVEDKKSEKE